MKSIPLIDFCLYSISNVKCTCYNIVTKVVLNSFFFQWWDKLTLWMRNHWINQGCIGKKFCLHILHFKFGEAGFKLFFTMWVWICCNQSQWIRLVLYNVGLNLLQSVSVDQVFPGCFNFFIRVQAHNKFWVERKKLLVKQFIPLHVIDFPPLFNNLIILAVCTWWMLNIAIHKENASLLLIRH